jgi:hypothetical protein
MDYYCWVFDEWFQIRINRLCFFLQGDEKLHVCTMPLHMLMRPQCMSYFNNALLNNQTLCDDGTGRTINQGVSIAKQCQGDVLA